MKVLFDHQIYNWQIYGGISRYHYELMKYLPHYETEVELSVKFSNNSYLKQEKRFNNLRFFPGFNLRIRNEFIRNSNMALSQSFLKSQSFDIFHPTGYDTYFLREGLLQKKPLVVTVHDLIHEKFQPEDTSIPEKHCLIEKADAIIAISENTKNDLLTYIPNIDPTKISVIYHGSNIKNQLTINRETPFKRPNYHYILFVGARERYKNFERFAKSFSLLSKKYPDIYLVCTGAPFTKIEKTHLKKLGISNRTVLFSVNDIVLSNLYKYAEFFIFPSLYEGFGIPILESFEMGCPMAISETSCFPEIASDAALYFNPYSEESMFYAMEELLIHTDTRLDLKKKGYERASLFSWDNTAKKTADLYKSMI